MSLDEVKALENKLAEQNERLKKSVNLTLIVYVVITLIVLGYTSVVVSKLQQATSPDAVADMASGMVQQHVPEQRAKLIATIQANKKQWADTAVQQVHASLPELEAKLEVLLESFANHLAEEIDQRLMPQFIDFIKEDAEHLKEVYKGATDEEIAEGFVEIFIEIIEKELDKFLNEKFVDAVNKLQIEMHELSKPGAQLTKKQDAERRLIQNWAHLSEHQEFGTALFTNFLTAMKRKFSDITQEDLEAVEAIEGVEEPLRLIEVDEE